MSTWLTHEPLTESIGNRLICIHSVFKVCIVQVIRFLPTGNFTPYCFLRRCSFWSRCHSPCWVHHIGYLPRRSCARHGRLDWRRPRRIIDIDHFYVIQHARIRRRRGKDDCGCAFVYQGFISLKKEVHADNTHLFMHAINHNTLRLYWLMCQFENIGDTITGKFVYLHSMLYRQRGDHGCCFSPASGVQFFIVYYAKHRYILSVMICEHSRSLLVGICRHTHTVLNIYYGMH